MAHPSDAALRITLHDELHKRLNFKVGALIKAPTERTAGYIQALHDVLRIISGDEDVAYDYAETMLSVIPTQEHKIG